MIHTLALSGEQLLVSFLPYITIIGNNHGCSTHPFKELDASRSAPDNARITGDPCVGNDCWLCDGAVIVGGVTIGDGAVVGAHAVVTRDVPPYAVVAGNPATVVRNRFPDHTVARMQRVRWWELVCERLAPVLEDVEEFIRRAEEIRDAM